MVFKIGKASIDASGTLVAGGDDFFVNEFTHPAIEMTNSDLKTFMKNREYDNLDKSKYEGELFRCASTNALYVNIMNWYRLKNTLPLDTEANYTVLLSRVDIVKSTQKPKNAFAQYNKYKDIWLTSPYTPDESTKANEGSTVYSKADGALLAKYAKDSSREISPSKTNVGTISSMSEIKLFFSSLSSLIPSASAYTIGTASFYVYILNGTIGARSCICTTLRRIISDPTIEASGGSVSIVSRTVSAVPSNLLFYRRILNGSSDVFACVQSCASLPDGRSFKSQFGNVQFPSSSVASYSKDATSIKEFATFAALSTYLSSQYTSGQQVCLMNMASSEIYGDTACTNLISVDSGTDTIIETMSDSCSFLIDKSKAPDIVYFKSTAYLNTDTSKTEIYIVNEVTSAKKYTEKASGRFVMSSIYIPSRLFMGAKISDIDVLQSEGTTLRQGMEIYIPSSNIDKILKEFEGMKIYSNWGVQGQILIYNDKINRSINTGLTANKTTFAVSIEGKNYVPFESSQNPPTAIQSSSFYYSANSYSGPAPSPGTAPTSIDEIQLYVATNFVKVTVS